MLEFVRSRKNNVEECSIIEYPPFKFLHGLVIIGAAGMYSESDNPEKKDEGSQLQGKLSLLRDHTFKAYSLLYKELVEKQQIDYNLVGCEEFLLLVPRRQEKAFGELSVNGVGTSFLIQALWAPSSSAARTPSKSTLRAAKMEGKF
jgi:hypothetical protein